MNDNWFDSTRSIGAHAERIAERYLRANGYTIAHRNWRCRAGEIDRVAWDGDTLVFVEVKSRLRTRQRDRYLFDTVTEMKKKRLRILAEIYLAFYYRGKARPPVRIDLLGVELQGETPTGKGSVEVVRERIEHLRGAIEDFSSS